MSVEKLKNLNMDRVLDNDEAIALSAFARQQIAEYEALEQAVPEWLEKSTDVLRTEIARRNRADDLRRMKEIEGRLETYRSPKQKEANDLAELAKLQKRLGLSKGVGK